MIGLGMVLKEILSRLFNPFNLKILDLYLEMWLWSPRICAEKALQGGSGYMGLHKNILLTILFIFNTFGGFLPLLFITIIY